MLVTADELQYDQDLGLVVAKGHVELSQNEQILLADTVTYNQRTDTVTASGHVSLMQPTGDIAFADYMELRENFRDGFIKDVRLLLFDGSRLAGNTARRVGGMRTEVRRAVYSPCELCADDPTRAAGLADQGREMRSTTRNCRSSSITTRSWRSRASRFSARPISRIPIRR